MLPIKYATVTTEKFYSEEARKKGEKTQPKKLQEVGVTFNYKRRVVSSIQVKETPKRASRDMILRRRHL